MVDHYICSMMETKACATYHSSVAVLKAFVEEEWNNKDTSNVVCPKFRSRVEGWKDF